MSAIEVNKAKHCDSQWSTHPFRGGVHTSSSVNARCQSLTSIFNDLHCNAHEFWMVSMLESIWNRLNQIGIIRWHLIATHQHKVHTTSPPTSSKHHAMIRLANTKTQSWYKFHNNHHYWFTIITPSHVWPPAVIPSPSAPRTVNSVALRDSLAFLNVLSEDLDVSSQGEDSIGSRKRSKI
jgi:hypothetical protein